MAPRTGASSKMVKSASADKVHELPKPTAAVVAALPAAHPTYNAMVKAAIEELNEKGGSSRQSILKLVCNKYSLGPNASKHVTNSLKKLCETKELVHAKSTSQGATGKFKLGGAKAVPPKKESNEKPEPAAKSKSKVTKSAKTTQSASEASEDSEDYATEPEIAPKPAPKVGSGSKRVSKEKLVDKKHKAKKPRVTLTPAVKRVKVKAKKSTSPTKPRAKRAGKAVL